MCLNQIERFETSGEGFKVLLSKKLTTEEVFHFPLFSMKVLKLNEWIEDDNQSMLRCSLMWDMYWSGFHIYDNYNDAKMSWLMNGGTVVAKVEYEQVTATGIEGLRNRVVVARKMRIIKICLRVTNQGLEDL